MLTEVRITNQYWEALVLPLDASSEYAVKKIDGLGPVKAAIATSAYAGMDGGVYQASRGGMRNIVLQLGFNSSYKVEDPIGELRRNLYRLIPPKMPVTLCFYSSNLEAVSIVGYVESVEPSIFSVEPEVQISIICPDPYFNSLVLSQAYGHGCSGSVIMHVTNPGNVQTGIQFTLSGLSSIYRCSVTRSSPYSAPAPSASPTDCTAYRGSLYTGETGNQLSLSINTLKGSKSATCNAINYNTGVTKNVNVIGDIYGWVELAPGANILDVEMPQRNYLWSEIAISFISRYVGL